jgi:hyperosmotically inducible protein
MTVTNKRILGIGAAVLLLAAAAVAAPGPAPDPNDTNPKMSDQVRKALVTLPYYGVFDNLEYKIDGSTITLSGQVVRPTTRSDAEHRVAKIEGVDRVVNNIEVLPLSSFDDSIRARTYRAVFRTGSLYRYAMGANPSIHIVVDNGRVTLEGVVSNKMDGQLAYMAANGVPGVFHVTNNLRVERGT